MPAVFARFLRDVAGPGPRIQVTELDVQDRLPPAEPGLRDRLAGEALGAVMRAALAEPAVDLVTAWGLSDRGTSADRVPDLRRGDGRPSRQHLPDEGFARKPAWHALAGPSARRRRGPGGPVGEAVSVGPAVEGGALKAGR